MTGVEFVRLAKRVHAHIGQDHRYAHTLRVARMAVRLARRYGENVERALLAGMLHDLARLYTPERLLAESRSRGLAVSAFEEAHPRVLHARLGAELAKEQFGQSDERILSAIRYHTLGAGTMTTLDAIVYLADSLEPGRDFEQRADLERLSFRDLDAAMRATLLATTAFHGNSGKSIAPETAAAIELFSSKEKKTA
ncbi:MAG TPA: bis(5'-nucleosyl)-tetraphosphatase (symmetrical) YqeK [Candidatus Acidoferrales bacterium]|nr:bis(5'-nucleosyl)-tetraphosphatase (symmetrical) YqeK [Candidatus Acidoferrales bacterium]